MTDTMNPAVQTTESTTVKSRKGRRIMALILVVLALLLAFAAFLLFRLLVPPGGPAADTETAGISWVRSIYGMSNLPEDQFDRAQAAVPGPDGTIWIVDSRQRVLMSFTPDGRYTGFVAGPEEAPLVAPSRFAVDDDGTFYVCETAGDTVRVLDSNGNEAGSFLIPSPVSIDVSEDRIVVGAVAGFAILDKEGNPLHVIGARGQEDYQFDYVHGVAIGDNGNIYVADSFNNRLSAYDSEGNRLWITRTGNPSNNAEMVDGRLTVIEDPDLGLAEAERLQLPLELTLDGAGRIVVIDMFECTLAVFDPEDGSLIGKYGVPGAEDGQFFYPVGVGYDAERDWFTVADNLNNRVQIVRIPGSSAGTAGEAVRRALAGPLRACFFPFILIVIALIVWLVARSRRRKKAMQGVPVEHDSFEINDD